MNGESAQMSLGTAARCSRLGFHFISIRICGNRYHVCTARLAAWSHSLCAVRRRERVRGDHPNRPMIRRLGGKSKIVRHYGESKYSCGTEVAWRAMVCNVLLPLGDIARARFVMNIKEFAVGLLFGAGIGMATSAIAGGVLEVRSGQAVGISIATSANGLIVYVANPSGVYKSEDGGETWRSLPVR
jgi:hypothetical protein